MSVTLPQYDLRAVDERYYDFNDRLAPALPDRALHASPALSDADTFAGSGSPAPSSVASPASVASPHWQYTPMFDPDYSTKPADVYSNDDWYQFPQPACTDPYSSSSIPAQQEFLDTWPHDSQSYPDPLLDASLYFGAMPRVIPHAQPSNSFGETISPSLIQSADDMIPWDSSTMDGFDDQQLVVTSSSPLSPNQDTDTPRLRRRPHNRQFHVADNEDDEDIDEDDPQDDDDDDDEWQPSPHRPSLHLYSDHPLTPSPSTNSTPGTRTRRTGFTSPQPITRSRPRRSSASYTSPPTLTEWNSAPPNMIPQLTKRSRGRQVPTVRLTATSNGADNEDENDDVNDEVTFIRSRRRGAASGRKANGVEDAAGRSRSYVCKVNGCGKCFQRGEHLKRHIRSIHTNEKRSSFCPFLYRLSLTCFPYLAYKCNHPGCGKDFSRRDNLFQHTSIHARYSHK